MRDCVLLVACVLHAVVLIHYYSHSECMHAIHCHTLKVSDSCCTQFLRACRGCAHVEKRAEGASSICMHALLWPALPQ